MQTPIVDFVARYAESGAARLHMPGHKGQPFLGCEKLDITEIAGADSLYEAQGIIAQSEQNAAGLFGSAKTLFSTEGSTQCIKAMAYLALLARKPGTKPVIAAARNVHKAFIFAAALLDFEIVWLWPQTDACSICACPITPAYLQKTLAALTQPPAGVYITSPDYLGGCADITALAEVCHGFGVPLLVDNAHGAYLHFLSEPAHPLDLGADLCCDSAHKTLPVLTGGAYLHISQTAKAEFAQNARQAMALFGSTSPSYLILQSLDLANRYLSQNYPDRLAACVSQINALRQTLVQSGWDIRPSDALRVVIRAGSAGLTGQALAQRLRHFKMECEYADPENLVLMLTPETGSAELDRLAAALRFAPKGSPVPPAPAPTAAVRRLSVRRALFASAETLPAADALGRICAAPTVACPPAIPIAVSGEEIGPAALALFDYYGVSRVDVVR